MCRRKNESLRDQGSGAIDVGEDFDDERKVGPAEVLVKIGRKVDRLILFLGKKIELVQLNFIEAIYECTVKCFQSAARVCYLLYFNIFSPTFCDDIFFGFY